MCMTARERLREWMKRNRMTQREAANLLGMHYTHFNQLLKGRRSPGLLNAIRIQRETGIAVDCWLPTERVRDERSMSEAIETGK